MVYISEIEVNVQITYGYIYIQFKKYTSLSKFIYFYDML